MNIREMMRAYWYREPEGRDKPTKKEIKKGGGKFSIRKNRNSEQWREELEQIRREK